VISIYILLIIKPKALKSMEGHHQYNSWSC